MIWPLGVLNRGTERRGSDEERTPSSSNRARRRTKLEVHGDARTRPKSARLRKRKETPSRIVPGPLLSPFKAPSGVRARDGRELSDTERAAFAKCMHFATRCGQASVADVCKEWGISKSHGYKILNRWRTEESVQSRPRSGRPCALTEEDMHTLECLSEELKGYFTWESLAKRFTEKTGKRVSCSTVYNSCKTAGWRQVCERYVPCLNAKDVARRLEWANQRLDYTPIRFNTFVNAQRYPVSFSTITFGYFDARKYASGFEIVSYSLPNSWIRFVGKISSKRISPVSWTFNVFAFICVK